MKIHRNLFIAFLALIAGFSANAQNFSYSYSEPGFSITLSNGGYGGYGYYNNYPNYRVYPAPNIYVPPVYYAPAPIYYGPPVNYYPNYQYRQPPRYGHRHDFRGHGYNNDRFRR